MPEDARQEDPHYRIWHRVRSPFTVPQACHRCSLHDWEVFDADKAGCLRCGRFHRCEDGGECIEISESDRKVCEITGCWIRTRNFQQGYTDTAVPSGSKDGANEAQAKAWVDHDRVFHWLDVLLCGETAVRCIDREATRVVEKVIIASNTFAKIAKTWKLRHRSPIILEMYAHTRFLMGNLRLPLKLQGRTAIRELMRTCVDAIMRFVNQFKPLLQPRVPHSKIDHFIIGLIYLLRTGIVMFDTIQVIPSVPILRRVLPMETCLKVNFRIPCKIITEVENLVKLALKTLNRRRIGAIMAR